MHRQRSNSVEDAPNGKSGFKALDCDSRPSLSIHANLDRLRRFIFAGWLSSVKLASLNDLLITIGETMMAQLLTHTPVWVWLLLAGLCFIGFQQTKTRQLSLQRLIILPFVMLALSLLSLKNSFGSQITVYFCWILSLLISACLVSMHRSSANGSYDEGSQLMTVHGSWLPFMLILGMFATRYILNAGLAMQAELAQQSVFSLSIATAFGLFNGAFLGRLLCLMSLRKSRALITA